MAFAMRAGAAPATQYARYSFPTDGERNVAGVAHSSKDRSKASRLRQKANRTAAEQAWLDRFDSVPKGKPGRKPRVTASWQPPPTVSDAPAPEGSSPPPADSPPSTDPGAGASTSSAPPIEVVDLSGGAAGADAGPPPQDAERAAAIAMYTQAAMEIYRRSRSYVVAHGGFGLPDQLDPVVERCWTITLERFLPASATDLTEAAPYVAVSTTVYHAGYAWILRNRERDKEKSAEEKKANGAPPKPSTPPPTPKPEPTPAAPPPAKADDDPFAGMVIDRSASGPR